LTKVVTLSKPKPQLKAGYRNLHSLAQKEKHSMKKEATPKYKGLKKERPSMKKKRQPQNVRGSKKKNLR
jgi:hypothetical protein